MNGLQTLGVDLDLRRDLLLRIKEINPRFYHRLYHDFLIDQLTFTDLEPALFRALATVGITLVVDEDLSLMIDYRTKSGNTLLEKMPDFESALKFSLGLLRIK